MIRKHSIMSEHKDETAWRAEEIEWTNKYELNEGISDQTKDCAPNVLSWLPGERWATDCHTDI
jgi:hypothetical protein